MIVCAIYKVENALQDPMTSFETVYVVICNKNHLKMIVAGLRFDKMHRSHVTETVLPHTPSPSQWFFFLSSRLQCAILGNMKYCTVIKQEKI